MHVAGATVWYVDVRNGDDNNAGTSPAQSFRSINHALSVALTEDTINVFPGRYHESVHIQTPGLKLEALPMKDPLSGVADEVIIEGDPAARNICILIDNSLSDIDEETVVRNFVVDGHLAGIRYGIVIADTGGPNGSVISPTVEGNTILDCFCGLSVYVVSPEGLCESLIRYNHIKASSPHGGSAALVWGIYISAENSGEIKCRLRSNRVFNNEYGIFAYDDEGDGVIDIRCMCNVVAFNEWGYYIDEYSTVIMDHETIAHGLTASSIYEVRGVENHSSTAEIHNSIIWLPNYIDSYGQEVVGIDLDNQGGAFVDGYSIIEDLSPLADPSFVDVANYDFHISSASAAIDIEGATDRIRPGSPWAVDYDNDGAPRIIDAFRNNEFWVDVGAFEYTEVGLDVTESYGGYDATMKPLVNVQLGGHVTLVATNQDPNPNGTDVFYLWFGYDEQNDLRYNLGNWLIIPSPPLTPLTVIPMGVATEVVLSNIPIANNPANEEKEFYLQGMILDQDPLLPGPERVGAFTRRIFLEMNP